MPLPAVISASGHPRQRLPETDVSGGLLRVDWGVADTTLTSITSYRISITITRKTLPPCPGLTPFNLVDAVKETSDQFSQELRLASDGHDKFNWLVGALHGGACRSPRGDLSARSARPWCPAARYCWTAILAFTQKADTTTYAAFAQLADYAFNEQWSVSVGSRYTYDEKDTSTRTGKL